MEESELKRAIEHTIYSPCWNMGGNHTEIIISYFDDHHHFNIEKDGVKVIDFKIDKGNANTLIEILSTIPHEWVQEISKKSAIWNQGS